MVPHHPTENAPPTALSDALQHPQSHTECRNPPWPPANWWCPDQCQRFYSRQNAATNLREQGSSICHYAHDELHRDRWTDVRITRRGQAINQLLNGKTRNGVGQSPGRRRPQCDVAAWILRDSS